MTSNFKNTHMNKADSYNIGRPHYPPAFFDYLDKIVLIRNSVIADVGAGTGKITMMFLERGYRVFALEPDRDMVRVLRENTKGFPGCTIVESTAENTGIPDDSTDLVFCGNSYMWFDRAAVIPEFRRIVRGGRRQNVILAQLGAGRNAYGDEIHEINKKFSRADLNAVPNNSPPFQSGMYQEKVFDYTIYQDFNEMLHGHLSASYAPAADDDCFEAYCGRLKEVFEKYSSDGRIETKMRLSCVIGSAEDLIH